MKRRFFVLFAFFVWFVGTNHCALEQVVGNHASACPCESSSSANDKHDHGKPCLSKSLPAQYLSFNLHNTLDLNLRVNFLLSNLFNQVEVESNNNIVVAEGLYSLSAQKIDLASQSPNSPPRV